MKSLNFLAIAAAAALFGAYQAWGQDGAAPMNPAPPKSDSASKPKAARKKTEAAAPSTDLSPKSIYQHDAPAVVLLMCTDAGGTGELGTGSVIDESGKIITNAHVVIRAASGQPYERIHVYFKPAHLTGDSKQDLKQAYEGRVAVYDRSMDLAVVELVDKPDNLKVLPIGDAETVDAGEPVVAIGHPEQGGLWTLTTGVVSTVVANLGGVKGKNAFQTDASINRGNSGGPLINRSGAMIGVNTSMARKAADGLTITSVNFSLKSSVVKDWLANSGVHVKYWEIQPGVSQDSPGWSDTLTNPVETKPAAENPDVKPAPKAPETAPEKIVAKAPDAVKPRSPEAAIVAAVTPKRPFKVEDMIQKDIAEMEDLEKEMGQEVDKRRDEIEAMDAAKRSNKK